MKSLFRHTQGGLYFGHSNGIHGNLLRPEVIAFCADIGMKKNLYGIGSKGRLRLPSKCLYLLSTQEEFALPFHLFPNYYPAVRLYREPYYLGRSIGPCPYSAGESVCSILSPGASRV